MRGVKRGETLPASMPGNYARARFNALKHGVLSRYTVLPTENVEEYQALLEVLVAEHQPRGPTEEYLVEELAGVMWRQRRLRLAESAAHHVAFTASAKEYREATAAEQKLGKDRENIESEQCALIKAFKALDGTSCTDDPSASTSLDEYQKLVRKNTVALGPEDLGHFDFHLTPTKQDFRHGLDRKPAIRAGSIAGPAELESFARYEVRLDRKLQWALSMLLKLQQLRRETERI